MRSPCSTRSIRSTGPRWSRRSPRRWRRAGRRPDCFVQVNIGDEPQKGGCAVAELPALLDDARAAGLPVAGLMCIPPEGVEAAPYFALLAKLARRHGLAGLSHGHVGGL